MKHFVSLRRGGVPEGGPGAAAARPRSARSLILAAAAPRQDHNIHPTPLPIAAAPAAARGSRIAAPLRAVPAPAPVPATPQLRNPASHQIDVDPSGSSSESEPELRAPHSQPERGVRRRRAAARRLSAAPAAAAAAAAAPAAAAAAAAPSASAAPAASRSGKRPASPRPQRPARPQQARTSRAATAAAAAVCVMLLAVACTSGLTAAVAPLARLLGSRHAARASAPAAAAAPAAAGTWHGPPGLGFASGWLLRGLSAGAERGGRWLRGGAAPAVMSMHSGSSGGTSRAGIGAGSSSSRNSARPQPPARGSSALGAPARAAAAGAAGAAAAPGDDAGGGGGGASTPAAGAGRGAAAAGGRITMYAVVDEGLMSPFKGGANWTASWGDVVRHMGQRLEWTDERFELVTLTQQQLKADAAAREALASAVSSSSSGSSSAPLLFTIAVSDPDVAAFISQASAPLPTALFWSAAGQLQPDSRVDGYAPERAGPLARLLAARVGFSREARAARVLDTLQTLWARHTSDDLLFVWLVLLNEYVTPVPLVADTTKGTDLASLVCMLRNCGSQIIDCVTDKTCKAGLDCLEGCAFNDQVCQYRCIVSYETPQFSRFALCILELHNCRNLNSQPPKMPDPAPMASFRGAPLTHEMAEALFIGWMAPGPQLPPGAGALKPYSWLVAAGKNPAYDHFPCQHQLYYAGKGKGQLWYEPVFKAVTLDGREVWRRRRYRVRRGTVPGSFHYSVLDNGVTSNEFWRILDCEQDLAFCLFYYSGAAATAGMSYSGAVLATPDGVWPTAHTQRVFDALKGAGIEPWELSLVDNSHCVGAPL